MVHCRDEEDYEPKEEAHRATENKVDVDLHIEHRQQKYGDGGADRDYPPEDRRNSGRDIGEAGPPKFDQAIQLTKRFGLNDFLPFLRRFEGQEIVDKY